MVFTAHAEAPPLREDAAGAVRSTVIRVLLELVIHAYQDGATPEAIVQRYSTLALSDVYAVIAYYLRHPAEVDDLMARREEKAEEVQRRIESEQADPGEIRDRILARRKNEA